MDEDMDRGEKFRHTVLDVTKERRWLCHNSPGLLFVVVGNYRACRYERRKQILVIAGGNGFPSESAIEQAAEALRLAFSPFSTCSSPHFSALPAFTARTRSLTHSLTHSVTQPSQSPADAEPHGSRRIHGSQETITKLVHHVGRGKDRELQL